MESVKLTTLLAILMVLVATSSGQRNERQLKANCPVAPRSLDRTTFLAPSQTELLNAMNVSFSPQLVCGQELVYVVIKVNSSSLVVPLSERVVASFIYALNNVTGVVWQFKGAVTSQVGVLPAAPYGLPQVKNGPPPSNSIPSTPALSPPLGRRRRLLSNIYQHQRRLTQAGFSNSTSPSTPEYAYSPPPNPEYAYSPPPSPDYAYSPPPSPEYAYSPPPSPEYAYSPPPSPDYAYSPPPSPDYAYSPPPSPEYSPPPFSPVPVAPPSMPPPSLPPPPKGPQTDGIWYFAVAPLTYGMQILTGNALATDMQAGSSGLLVHSLKASGIELTGVELRYFGNASNGQMDLSNSLQGIIFAAATPSQTPAPSPSSGGMSGGTIGAIVGGVVGGLVLLTAVVAFFVLRNRKSRGDRKDSLSQKWKAEREKAEAERMRLETEVGRTDQAQQPFFAARPASSPPSEHDFAGVSPLELENRRAARQAEVMETASQNFSQAPSESAQSARASRLEALRNSLRLMQQ
jgi:hypothetical protein